MNACGGAGYYCEGRYGSEKPFVFNKKRVTVNYNKSFYFTKKNIKQEIERRFLYKKGNRLQVGVDHHNFWTYEYHDPLIAKLGAYNAKKSEEEVVVSWVIELVRSLSQLPSGEVVDTDTNYAWREKVYNKREYSRWVDFAIPTFQVIRYVFNIPNKTLVQFVEYPFPPESGEKTSYQFENGQWLTKYLGPMSKEELNDKKFYSQHNRSESYKCKKLEGELFWIYHSYPLWGWMIGLT